MTLPCSSNAWSKCTTLFAKCTFPPCDIRNLKWAILELKNIWNAYVCWFTQLLQGFGTWDRRRVSFLPISNRELAGELNREQSTDGSCLSWSVKELATVQWLCLLPHQAEVILIEAEVDQKVNSTNERVLLLDSAQACIWVTFSINSTVKITFSKNSTVKITNIAFCKQSHGGVGLRTPNTPQSYHIIYK